jgi:SAM-dependent methyltransferase
VISCAKAHGVHAVGFVRLKLRVDRDDICSMNEAYWDRLASTYTDEVHDNLAADRDGVIVRWLDEFASQRKTAVDFGCGIGHYLRALAPRFRSVHALDHSSELLRGARASHRDLDSVVYQKVDLSRPLKGWKPVDFGVCMNVLIAPNHGWRTKMLTTMRRALKPGGHLLMLLPSLESSLYTDTRLIEWNMRRGMSHDRALRVGLLHGAWHVECRSRPARLGWRDTGKHQGDDRTSDAADDRRRIVGCFLARAEAELADAPLERRHAPRREDTAHQAAMQVVDGRVLEDEHAAGRGDAGADYFEHRSLAGNEGLPVARACLHVVESPDRKEVEAVVAVQRHLVAHAHHSSRRRTVRALVRLSGMRIPKAAFSASRCDSALARRFQTFEQQRQ